MKHKKDSGLASNIHKQQLFHWIGGDLDKENRNRKVLRDDLVKKCLDNLRRSLEHGIWVKTPDEPEQIDFTGKNSKSKPLKLDIPIACFTEWSLGDSLRHTKEYGRIGFGFPKRWVIERGGQSVTYFKHNQRGAFLKSAFLLLDQLGEFDEIKNIWKPKADSFGFGELHYLLHFAKMIREKTPPASRKVVAPTVITPADLTLKKKATKATVEAHTFKRKFGRPLDFVEEREWRIVYHSANKKLFEKGPGTPTYYLPYAPGEELFTLVLPDNKVVSKVLQRDWFTERLFTPWKHYKQLNGRRVPPVTLLSHSDIGTF